MEEQQKPATKQPVPWVIIGRLQDASKARVPALMHGPKEVASAIEGWNHSRRQFWPTEGPIFGMHTIFGNVSFMSDKLKKGGPYKGFMLYGFSNLDTEKTKFELAALGAILGIQLGHQAIELHLARRIWELTIEKTSEPP